MDNIRFHCGEEIKHFLLARGVRILMLPTYSPDLIPNENIYGCIKARIDKIKPRAETREIPKKNICIILEYWAQLRDIIAFLATVQWN
ncbi:hypothetical protein H312_00577 [Anncaliia algerae PRA339]|uniref:Tc1-like transposase DDE domain-containing protein n=1 Tax=Anncaliia algerae PRA339 TaxID=1288291 RepID=A0A059F4K7_9MICR|nr:hypothetical protein H312_00577 [Anncaliia algerae PRA339]